MTATYGTIRVGKGVDNSKTNRDSWLNLNWYLTKRVTKEKFGYSYSW